MERLLTELRGGGEEGEREDPETERRGRGYGLTLKS
ncbi:hypothetical protein ES705_28612 [subsurface metagenome]